MEIIRLFCDMFISAGDEVIITQPTFSEYEWAVKRNGGLTIDVFRAEKDNFHIKSKPVINNINPQTKVVFICNPNNPNGDLDEPSEILEIIEYASEEDVLIFLDEAFIEFTGEVNSFIKQIHNYNNIFISRSFTKYFGLPGLRIGFGVSNLKIINYMKRGQSLWSVNCIAQEFAKIILKMENLFQKTNKIIQSEREFIMDSLGKYSEIKIYPSNANYLLINTKALGIKAIELKSQLLKKGILIRDCSNYKGLDEFFFRISIQERKKNEILIQALMNIINSV